MDEQQGRDEGSGNRDSENPAVPPPAIGEEKGHQPKPEELPEDKPSCVVERKIKRQWKAFMDAGIDRFIELFLATAITLFALGQWITSCNNNRSTSLQTNKLIESAQINACAARQIAEASKRNATAAEGFATSAGNINVGIAEAVGKLNLQAGATQALAREAARASNISEKALKASDRPWMGVDTVVITLQQDKAAHLNVRMRNFGRSPALKFIVNMGWQFNHPPDKDMKYVIHPLHPGEETSFSTIMPNQATAMPEAVDEKLTPNSTVMKMLTEKTAKLYFFGEARYYDWYGVEHITHFCSIYSPSGDAVVCNEYNDAN